MKKEISAKQKLILLIVTFFVVYVIPFVAILGALIEEEKENRRIADTYIRTHAVVIEVGEVRESQALGAVGWHQQCVIEYNLPDGRVRQVSYIASDDNAHRPLGRGQEMEVLISPNDYCEVESVYKKSYPSLAVCNIIMIVGVMLYGGLIAKHTMNYRREKQQEKDVP